VIDGGQVCFIDKKKMVEKIMAKGDACLDSYIYGVANGFDNSLTRSEFDLKTFLTDNEINDVVSSKCKLVGKTDAKLPIKGVIKSPLGEPYFPGSSIKGALKTVLMYNWLKTNGNADKMIEEVINGKDVEDENGEMNHITVDFTWLEKEFECSVNNNDELIRSNTIQQVTDSTKLASKGDNIVVDCERNSMPIRFECIAADKTVDFYLSLENYCWTDLAKQANQYASDCLKRELNIVGKDAEKIYKQTINRIQRMIENEQSDDVAYLRLGFGKGYFLNSLGIAVFEYVSQNGKEELYKKFEDFINEEFAKEDKKTGEKKRIDLKKFPTTRLFIEQTQEPMGWVKIISEEQQKKNDAYSSLVNAAQNLLSESKFDEAKAEIDKAIQIFPNGQKHVDLLDKIEKKLSLIKENEDKDAELKANAERAVAERLVANQVPLAEKIRTATKIPTMVGNVQTWMKLNAREILSDEEVLVIKNKTLEIFNSLKNAEKKKFSIKPLFELISEETVNEWFNN
jgi:CRISPR-associated protein Csm5